MHNERDDPGLAAGEDASGVREVDVRLAAHIGAEPSRVFDALARPESIAALATQPGKVSHDPETGRVRVQAQGQRWGTEIVQLASEPPSLLQLELIVVADMKAPDQVGAGAAARPTMFVQAQIEPDARGGSMVELELRLIFLMEDMPTGLLEGLFGAVFKRVSVWFLRRRCRAWMITVAGELKAEITFKK
jgi:uncharacterized protein YndB with AHSA1/START domain